jgi:hypothetical protein
VAPVSDVAGRSQPRAPVWPVALGGFPAPSVVVLADDRFAIAGQAGHAVIIVPAELARLVAGAFIADRVARSRGLRSGWRRSRRRRGRLGGRRYGDRPRPGPQSCPAAAGASAAGHAHGDHDQRTWRDIADPESQRPGAVAFGPDGCAPAVQPCERPARGHLCTRHGADTYFRDRVVSGPPGDGIGMTHETRRCPDRRRGCRPRSRVRRRRVSALRAVGVSATDDGG